MGHRLGTGLGAASWPCLLPLQSLVRAGVLLVSLEGFVFLRSWRGVTSVQGGHEALLEQLEGRRYFQHRYLRQKKKAQAEV